MQNSNGILTLADACWYDILGTVPSREARIDILAEVMGRPMSNASSVYTLIEDTVSDPEICSPKFLAEALNPNALHAFDLLAEEGKDVANHINAHGRIVARMKNGEPGIINLRESADGDPLHRGKGKKPFTILDMVLLIKRAQPLDCIKKENYLTIPCDVPEEGFKQLLNLGPQLSTFIQGLSISHGINDLDLNPKTKQEGIKAVERFLTKPAVHSFAVRKAWFNVSPVRQSATANLP